MTNVLWHIELSHYSEKARWALDYKGVGHRKRRPMLGLHQPLAMALTRSRHRRMPVLRLDGRTVGDSTAIIAALAGRHRRREHAHDEGGDGGEEEGTGAVHRRILAAASRPGNRFDAIRP